jgi:general secretion pathway protein A
MYETHFGFKRRAFRALALGNDVFIGPQTAAAMAATKKALATTEAIAAIIGPAGGGKTTVVGRAIDGLPGQCITVQVGRIRLGTDEVLEMLLGELGIDEMPASTVQRFTLFRRLLQKYADEGSRVVVVVEDAARIGVDSLCELEALTSTDAGVSDGANIVLMGDEGLKELLSTPALARVKQRLRVSYRLAPLATNELHAYLKHCFRLAGGDFDALFAAEAMALVHELSDGIPRMANNLVESAMVAAAEAGNEQVSEDQVRTVAASEYGLETATPTAPAEVAIAPPASMPEPEPEPATESAKAPEAEPTLEPEDQPDAETATTQAARGSEAAPADDDGIPELIQDTLPDLEVLAPQLAGAAPTANNAPVAEHDLPSAPADEPVLPAEDPVAHIVTDPTAKDQGVDESADKVPDWEREPTLAELRPDLDALEHAMAVAQGLQRDDDAEDLPVIQPEPAAEPVPQVIPEITLDREIRAKIEEAAEAIKRSEEAAAAKAAEDAEAEKAIDIAATGEMQVEMPPLSPSAAKPEPDAAPAAPPQAPSEPAVDAEPENSGELNRIATDLSQAKTIDDVDDKMAETLFGEEFSEIAAQIAANASALPANDELEFMDEEPVAQVAPIGGSDGKVAVQVNPEGRTETSPPPRLDEAASRRLATVRALNGAPDVAPPMPLSAESIVMSHEPPAPRPSFGNAHPESIEDQINTSMTATLKALKMQPDVDDNEDEGKKGFFGLFRRS